MIKQCLRIDDETRPKENSFVLFLLSRFTFQNLRFEFDRRCLKVSFFVRRRFEQNFDVEIE